MGSGVAFSGSGYETDEGSGPAFFMMGPSYTDYLITVPCVWDDRIQDVRFEFEPQCRPVPCPDFEVPEHADMAVRNDEDPTMRDGDYVYGTEVYFSCHSG